MTDAWGAYHWTNSRPSDKKCYLKRRACGASGRQLRGLSSSTQVPFALNIVMSSTYHGSGTGTYAPGNAGASGQKT